MDVADDQIGEAIGPPYTLSQGNDPLGNPYVVKARNYQNGLAVVRCRGDWDEGIALETSVTVPLPVPLAPITPSGSIGSPVGQITLRNGQGCVLLGNVTGQINAAPSATELEWSFRVLSTSPLPRTTNVPRTSEIRWVLSDACDPQSLIPSRVVVAGKAGPISGQITTEDSGRRIVFRPWSPLPSGEILSVSLSGLIRATSGEYLDGDGDGMGAGDDSDSHRLYLVVAGTEVVRNPPKEEPPLPPETNRDP
jgi:hypothetical protein